MTTFVDRAGHGLGAGDQRQPRSRLRRARPRARPPRHADGRGASTARRARSPSRARARARSRSTSGTSCTARCAPPSSRWAPPSRAPARLRQRDPARPRARARRRRRSSPGVCLARGLVGRRLAADGRRRGASRWPPSSRGTPTTSRRRCYGGFTVAYRDGDRFRAATARGRPAGAGRSPSCRRTASRPRSPAGCCRTTVPHADAAANAGRAALLVAALAGQPELLLAATEDRLHQDYRSRRCRIAARWSGALRADGLAGGGLRCRPDGAGAHRRRPAAERAPRRAPDGWQALALPLDRRRRPGRPAERRAGRAPTGDAGLP